MPNITVPPLDVRIYPDDSGPLSAGILKAKMKIVLFVNTIDICRPALHILLPQPWSQVLEGSLCTQGLIISPCRPNTSITWWNSQGQMLQAFREEVKIEQLKIKIKFSENLFYILCCSTLREETLLSVLSSTLPPLGESTEWLGRQTWQQNLYKKQ